MTRYCPSCGKPNTEQADKCASCGAALSPPEPPSEGSGGGGSQGGAHQGSGGKFKGTMMMGVASPPGAPGAGESEEQGGGAESGTAESGTAESGTAGSAGTSEQPDPGQTGGEADRGGPRQGPEQGGQADNLGFKKTMLGPGGAGVPPASGESPGGTPGSGASGPAEGTSGSAEGSAGQGPAKRGPRGTVVAGSPPPGPEPSEDRGADRGAPADAGKGPRGTVVAAGPPAGPASAPEGQGRSASGSSEEGGASPGGSEAVSGKTVQAEGPPAGVQSPKGASPGEAADPETVGPPQTSATQRNKMILWIALGCLGLALLGCLIGGIVALQLRGGGAADVKKARQELASRAGLLLALDGIHSSCEGGGSGRAAKQYFHPDAFERLKPRACNLDKRAISAFTDVQKSSSEVLAKTDAASKATELGLDASSCQRYTAGKAYIIACDTADKLRVIDMGNLAAVP